jgi:hypothetical protein
LNPYLFGSLVLLGVWGIVLVVLGAPRWRRERREFWWGSAVCSLLGFSEPLYVPEYWSPPSVFSYHRWDLESFLFCFAVGGIASVLPNLGPARELFYRLDHTLWRLGWRVRSSLQARGPQGEQGGVPMGAASEAHLTKTELRRDNMLLVALFLGAFGTTAHLHLNVIYDTSLTSAAAGLFIAWRTPRLRWEVVAGGISFVLLYALVLGIISLRYPEFFQCWNLQASSGRSVLGAPIEEYLFAATFGMFWAPLYEAWTQQRSAPLAEPVVARPLFCPELSPSGGMGKHFAL